MIVSIRVYEVQGAWTRLRWHSLHPSATEGGKGAIEAAESVA